MFKDFTSIKCVSCAKYQMWSGSSIFQINSSWRSLNSLVCTRYSFNATKDFHLNKVEDSWLPKRDLVLREGSRKTYRPKLRNKDIIKRNLGVTNIPFDVKKKSRREKSVGRHHRIRRTASSSSSSSSSSSCNNNCFSTYLLSGFGLVHFCSLKRTEKMLQVSQSNRSSIIHRSAHSHEDQHKEEKCSYGMDW